MIIYLDTETSSLRPGKICQLSYVMQTSDSVTAKNFFFSVAYVEPSAQAVHGFSVEKLKELSCGKKFIDNVIEIEEDFLSASLIIAHNTAFDFSFLRKEFEETGRLFRYKNDFCSMKKFTPVLKLKRANSLGYKYPKLCELTAFFGVSDQEINIETKRLFEKNLLFHDARYDTTAVYLTVNRAMENLEDFKFLKQELV